MCSCPEYRVCTECLEDKNDGEYRVSSGMGGYIVERRSWFLGWSSVAYCSRLNQARRVLLTWVQAQLTARYGRI